MYNKLFKRARFKDAADDVGGEDNNTKPSGGEPSAEEKQPESKPMSFDDFLKQSGNQSEFDRRVAKAINTAKAKWQIQIDDAVSEAEKLATMNAEEKAKYQAKKREKELEEREKAITRRELEATAKNTLAEKKLPIELASVLNYETAETCNASITSVESAFQTAVEKAVAERLSGGEPMKKAPSDDTTSLEEQIANAIKGF